MKQRLFLSYDGVAIALMAIHVEGGIYRAENHDDVIEIHLRNPENRQAEWRRQRYGEKAYLRDVSGTSWAVYTDCMDIFDK